MDFPIGLILKSSEFQKWWGPSPLREFAPHAFSYVKLRALETSVLPPLHISLIGPIVYCNSSEIVIGALTIRVLSTLYSRSALDAKFNP